MQQSDMDVLKTYEGKVHGYIIDTKRRVVSNLKANADVHTAPEARAD